MASRRLTLDVEGLEPRAVPDATVVALDPARLWGPQVFLAEAHQDSTRAVFSLFDTGSATLAFTTADLEHFKSLGAPVSVKTSGGVTAEGIGGSVTGDVSEPGTILVDGLHAATMSYPPFRIIPEFGFSFDSALSVPGVQAFLGLGADPGTAELPALTGTPILEPTADHPEGRAARIDMQGVTLDFSPTFDGDVLKVPDLHFVAPGTGLAGGPDTTAPVSVPLRLQGPDNHADPGAGVTTAPVPFQPDVALTVGSQTIEHREFLFDTGSQFTFLSTATARALGLDPAHAKFDVPVAGLADGLTGAPAFVLDRLTLPTADGGTLAFTSVVALVLDMPGAGEGVLGTNLFNSAAALLYDPYGPDGPRLGATFFTNPDPTVQNYDNVIGFQAGGVLIRDGGIQALPVLSLAPNAVQTQTVDGAAAYVIGLYRTVLGRAPEPAGRDAWVGRLAAGTSRAQVAAGFWESAEHRGRQVDQYYQTFLGRTADADGRVHWVDAFRGGADEAAVTRAFLTSPEYQTLHGPAADLVAALYRDVFGRSADAAGQAFWQQALQARVGREAVIDAFLDSDELRQARVAAAYGSCLGRAPDAVGATAWANALQDGDVTPEGLAERLLASPEFVARWLTVAGT